MKIEEYENKIKHLVDTENAFFPNLRFPDDLIKYGMDDSVLNLAILLSVYKPFTKIINSTRRKLGVELLDTNEKSMETIYDLIMSKADKTLVASVEKKVCTLIDKFKLDDSWSESIKILIFTNIFFVPHWAVVGIHKPGKGNVDVLGYPAIYFFRKTTPTELIAWIKRNFLALDKLQECLPEKSVHRIERVTIWSGYRTFICRNVFGIKSWAKIRDAEDRLTKKYFRDNNDGYIEETETEIKDRYLNFLKKINGMTKNLIS